MKVNITSRTDFKDFFGSDGFRETSKFTHHPFLVFVEKEKEVTVEIIDSLRKLIEFPVSTKVMAQWPGKYKSDFIQFTVGDLKEYIETNPKRDYYVI